MIMKKYTILVPIMLILLSCSQEKTAVLWSNNRETAHIVDLFNNGNSEYKIVLKYKENLAASYLKAEKKPDIIIGKGLQNSRVKSSMQNLDHFYNKYLIGKNEINRTLLEDSYFDSKIHLIPLSFSLTTAVYNIKSKNFESTLPTLELEQMKELSIQFNEKSNKKGFSPFLDLDFINVVLSLHGTSFSLIESDTLSWNEEKLSEAVYFLEDWNVLNGGTEEMEIFNTKYMYDNRIKILKEDRILFSVMTISDFFLLSDKLKKELDFIYLSNRYKMYPVDKTHIGINKDTNASNASYEFLKWLIKPETQENIIKFSIKNKTGTFGFFNGFSSIKNVNSNVFHRYYPDMKGKIPEPQYIQPTLEKPFDFAIMEKELIAPWVIKKINNDNSTFGKTLENWEKLRIPF